MFWKKKEKSIESGLTKISLLGLYALFFNGAKTLTMESIAIFLKAFGVIKTINRDVLLLVTSRTILREVKKDEALSFSTLFTRMKKHEIGYEILLIPFERGIIDDLMYLEKRNKIKIEIKRVNEWKKQ